MKTSDETMAFVAKQFESYLQHPAMYALSPESMEQMLIVLDLVRLYITSDEKHVGDREFRGQYYDFLMQQGCGAALLTLRFANESTDELFEHLCSFWRQYLSQSNPPLPIA